MEMTDTERLMVVIGFIKGVIGNNKYYASISVESVNDILREIGWKSLDNLEGL